MISKILITTLLTLPLWPIDFAMSSTLDCRTVKVQHSELGESIRPEVLGNLYARAMLKIAAAVVEDNFETFEDAALTIIQNSQSKSLNELKARISTNKLRNPNRRIPNDDFARVASLLGGKEDNQLNEEELRALWLVYLADSKDSKIDFSKTIFNLISKKEDSILVTVPQLQLAISSYPTSCLQERFSKDQLLNVMNKLNEAVANKDNDVTIEDNNILFSNSVLVELPTLKITKKKYNSEKIFRLEVGERLLSEVGGSFNSYRKSNAVIHGVSNLETIKHFHKFYGLSHFAVLSKKDKILTIYDESANILDQLNVIVSSIDDRINSGGAGIYHSAIKNQNIYYAKAASDNGMREVFRLKKSQSIYLNGPLYILPIDTNEHKFRIKNKKLAFSGYQFYRKSRNFNYTMASDSKFKLVIKNTFKSKFVTSYITTLEKEKSNLMKILKIDNDDYNMLAGFAIGVLAPESDFGKNWKYVLKEFLPGAVSIAKGNGLDISKNSRGPTQVKVISSEIMQQYSMTKDNLGKPENAAVATIAISSDFLKQLRVIGVNHKLINEENIQNYLYYLYQGKRMQIKEALATPEDNLAIKKIMNVVNGLEFLEY
jgi:hypothetical protein